MGKHRRAIPQLPWKAANRAYLIRKYGKHNYESGKIVTIVWQEALAREMVRSFWDQFTREPNDFPVRVTPLK